MYIFGYLLLVLPSSSEKGTRGNNFFKKIYSFFSPGLSTFQCRRMPLSIGRDSRSVSRMNADSLMKPSPSVMVGASFPPMMILPINV